MKVVIIVQARMTSTRLPGKILLPVLGKPLLEYQLERLRRVRNADGIVIATTVNATDEPVAAFCRANGVPCFRGSEADVLSRYAGAAREAKAEAVVRITSDCPLIDPAVVERVIAEFLRDGRCDYVSNVEERSYPRGMDCEIFSMAALERSDREAVDGAHREHVTLYINDHPGDFRCKGVAYATDQSRHRWTVDTPEDFALIKALLEALYPANPRFDMEACLAYLEDHPGLSELNAHVEQKKT
jgi:spore coat polysaccharide biosynthesis protein SpsF